ncbi:Uncharacterised protein [uncultured archaeon]|nr:Uncharacterised protein [uncultured archaeon]
MDAKKLVLYIMLVSSLIVILSQTPQIQAIGRGQHTFVNGRNVDCVACHRYDAYQDLNNSQSAVLEMHKSAAGNKNYTTYLEVGGISYDPVAGLIYTNVDSDNNGTNDTWAWNGSIWVYNNTAKLYDLDLNGDGTIEGSEICKLCHNLELMGVSTAASEVHTVGIRYCDDDRCHGNKNKQYNDYRLFQDGRASIMRVGAILNTSVHGGFYSAAASMDSNNSIYFHSYGQVAGNAAPNNSDNVSVSPFTCVGCHSYINVSGSVRPSPLFNHSDINAPKSRYT